MRSSPDKPLISEQQQSVLHLLAFQYLWNGMPDKAQPLYELLLSCMPDVLQVRTGLACAQIQNGAPEDALQTLAPFAKVADPVVQLIIARALSLQGDQAGASEAMQQFCEVRPPWRGPVLADAQRDNSKKKKIPKGAQNA